MKSGYDKVNIKNKVNYLFITALVQLLLSFLLFQPAVASETYTAKTAGIPMAKGNYWVYRGKVKYAESGAERSCEKTVELRMEMGDVFVREGGIEAAAVKGYPLDITGFDGRTVPRNDYLLVRAGSGSYYLLGGGDAVAAVKKLKDKNDILHELVDESDMIADFPLAAGKVFGEAEQVTRTDGRYFWRVEECVEMDLSTVKGSPFKRAIEYWLFYMTNPDRQKAGIVPGVGITSYSYRHNGTIMEFDVKLSECLIKTNMADENVLKNKNDEKIAKPEAGSEGRSDLKPSKNRMAPEKKPIKLNRFR